jgi:uncharacterized phage protein (TIGR02218 family)
MRSHDYCQHPLFSDRGRCDVFAYGGPPEIFWVMKQTSTAVIDLINAARAAPDAPIAFAECFTLITTTGTAYTWTSVDYDVVFNGFTFNASGPLVSGLKYKGSVGLEVDKQQITIAARPTDLINGAPFLIALRDGAFDGAPVYRDRVFLTGPMGTVVGGVRLFQGRVSTVDNVGRTQATLTVASDLVILDYDMPKNLFSPTCLHVLYDAGCGIVRGTFSLDGACGAGSNSSTINFSGARAGDVQGSLVFTSGANANVRATVKSVGVGALYNLMYPLPFAPATGDTFNIAFGCDHTQATCANKFNNLPNFRGFPYVPPPQVAF